MIIPDLTGEPPSPPDQNLLNAARWLTAAADKCEEAASNYAAITKKIDALTNGELLSKGVRGSAVGYVEQAYFLFLRDADLQSPLPVQAGFLECSDLRLGADFALRTYNDQKTTYEKELNQQRRH